MLCGAQHVEEGFVGTSGCPWEWGGEGGLRGGPGGCAVTWEGRDPGDRGLFGGSCHLVCPQLEVSALWVQLGVPPGFSPPTRPPYIFKPLLRVLGHAPPSIATPKMAPGMKTLA